MVNTEEIRILRRARCYQVFFRGALLESASVMGRRKAIVAAHIAQKTLAAAGIEVEVVGPIEAAGPRGRPAKVEEIDLELNPGVAP